MPNEGYPESMSEQETLDDAEKTSSGGVPTEGDKVDMLAGMYALQDWITDWAIRKGWLVPSDPPRDLLHQLMLVVSEVAEACEAYRNGNPPCGRTNMSHISHVEEELADTVIRLFQLAGEHGFKLSEAIILKMDFNESRPHKHGKTC